MRSKCHAFVCCDAQERLVQACKCVVLAYADREEHAMGLEMSQPGLDHSALVEEVKETTALVILALGSMMHVSEEQASFFFLTPGQRQLLPAPFPYWWFCFVAAGRSCSCPTGFVASMVSSCFVYHPATPPACPSASTPGD